MLALLHPVTFALVKNTDLCHYAHDFLKLLNKGKLPEQVAEVQVSESSASGSLLEVEIDMGNAVLDNHGHRVHPSKFDREPKLLSSWIRHSQGWDRPFGARFSIDSANPFYVINYFLIETLLNLTVSAINHALRLGILLQLDFEWFDCRWRAGSKFDSKHPHIWGLSAAAVRLLSKTGTLPLLPQGSRQARIQLPRLCCHRTVRTDPRGVRSIRRSGYCL